MTFEKLDFSHKDLLRERFKKSNAPLSEYSFANIYLFREVHRYEILFDREVFIRGISYDGRSYLMPTVKINDIDRAYLRELMASVDFLFPVPEEWLQGFQNDDFELTYREGDMDYVYTVEKMSTLRGRYLHRKRNLLKQFVTEYRHEAMPLTTDRIADALLILEEWHTETGADDSETDYLPCLEALQMYDDLMLCGGIYYADGEPAGFVLGEELDRETFVLHFAKARKRFKGVYQYMFNRFAQVLPPQYRFLNLEQDLDKDTLRLAKSSYMPDSMLKKMRIGLKKD
ncbi:MAG TPA: phosphatidylglycerol lysyltransferase domain-containing protein [Thermodesulfovibrionales bacterium]|nr:phosphatidylglycerol lysyltransferase domain-containing protein [Thermodesulfovibrionales bacterium]